MKYLFLLLLPLSACAHQPSENIVLFDKQGKEIRTVENVKNIRVVNKGITFDALCSSGNRTRIMWADGYRIETK